MNSFKDIALMAEDYSALLPEDKKRIKQMGQLFD